MDTCLDKHKRLNPSYVLSPHEIDAILIYKPCYTIVLDLRLSYEIALRELLRRELWSSRAPEAKKRKPRVKVII
ncbi:MAG: hypothetical protein QW101_05065 [Ignisphaera sp.]